VADGTELGRGIKKKLAKAKEQAYTELYVPREQQKQRYLFERGITRCSQPGLCPGPPREMMLLDGGNKPEVDYLRHLRHPRALNELAEVRVTDHYVICCPRRRLCKPAPTCVDTAHLLLCCGRAAPLLRAGTTGRSASARLNDCGCTYKHIRTYWYVEPHPLAFKLALALTLTTHPPTPSLPHPLSHSFTHSLPPHSLTHSLT
jgi:hypothetical protein